MTSIAEQLQDIRAALASQTLIPYIGAGLLEPAESAPVPNTPELLATFLSSKASVPGKIRNRLTACAQFIENFKHRKTLVTLMQQAFSTPVTPTSLQRTLAAMPDIKLIVDVWYDDGMRNALLQATGDDDPSGSRPLNWGQVQGLAQSEHFGQWFQHYDASGAAVDTAAAATWQTVLYQPIGAQTPAANYLVSDSDYVEVLTEIDIQTPIPPLVQSLRRDGHFLFLGCRFSDQLQRSFARQIIKRSSLRHWAVLSGPLTRNELRFMAEYGIQQIDMPLAEFETALTAELQLLEG